MCKYFSNSIRSLLLITRSAREMMFLAWHAQPYCFVGLIIFEVLQGIIPLGMAWITKVLFDLIAEHFRRGALPPWPELTPLFVGSIFLGLIGQSLQSANNYLNSELSRELTMNVQSTINRKVAFINGLVPFEDPKFYDQIRQAVQGAQLGPQQTVTILSMFVRSLIMLVGFVGLLISFSPVLTLLVLLVVIPQLYSQLRFGKQHFNIALLNSPKERLADYYIHILTGIETAKELRLFGLADYFLSTFSRTFREINESKRKQQIDEIRIQWAVNLISNLISSGALIVVVLSAFAGSISVGSVTLYITAIGNVQTALAGLVFSYSMVNENAMFYSRFTQLLALPEPLSTPHSPRPIFPLSASIEFRDVSFRYNKELPWVLNKLNLTITIGASLAIVGLNGAGKTTLVKLLSRLYDPDEGQILWDGVDIREFDIQDYRKCISAIYQDFVRFDLTAFENIAFGDLSKLQDDASVMQAARRAGIHGTIELLPNGYQTILSRTLNTSALGVDLSGGEWQKIALARMFLRDANVLILDEPTAALDVQAESALYEQFLKLMRGRTSILISHRFGTVRMASRIAVLSEGQIIEAGTHEELIRIKGVYKTLYSLQAEHFR